MRTNERGLELTFHKPSKRWCKVIDGKRHSFGSGSGVSDRESYKAAVSKYRDMIDKLDTEREEADKMGKVEQIIAKHAFDEDAPPLTTEELSAMVAAGAMPQEIAAVVDPATRVVAAPDRAVATLVESYVEKEKQRRDLTRSNPTALPRKSRLSPHSFLGLKYCVKTFEDYAVNQAKIPTLEDDAQVERLLLGYRRFLESEMIGGRIAPSTVNARIVYLAPFFRWAWKARHIAEMPRCLDEVCKKYSHTPTSKPLPMATIQKLWKHADGRMKALIALALNAGMYAVEIATTQGKHIKNGYIARHRNKTGVPYKIKLWPLTQKLLTKHRDGKGAEEFLFLTKQGHPLVHDGPESKSNALAQSFAKLVEEAEVEASWSQFRDTSATLVEKIATTGRGEVDKGLVSMFLAHADTRTARFYVHVDPDTIPTAKLDKVIDKLEAAYGLTVKEEPAKGSEKEKL